MCSLYISYNRYHGVFRKVLFVAVLFWSRLVHADLAVHATLAALRSGRDSCMLTSRCMLPWPRSAPYPALCPCEILGPVATCKRCPMVLVPDSTVHYSLVAVLVETRACWPRDACYPGCARHLTPLYVPVSPWARSVTCKPCPKVLIPDSTVHCSRPPARNLHLSSSDHALGPWVRFMYILPCYDSHMMWFLPADTRYIRYIIVPLTKTKTIFPHQNQD